MPNRTSIHHCKEDGWKAYVFHDDGDGYGTHLVHNDYEAPCVKRLALIAHHDEIMALLTSDDHSGNIQMQCSLRKLVLNSMFKMADELRVTRDELYAAKREAGWGPITGGGNDNE